MCNRGHYKMKGKRLRVDLFLNTTVRKRMQADLRNACWLSKRKKTDLTSQSAQPTPDWGDLLHPKSTTFPPSCLLTTDSVQWTHTPLPPLQGSQSHQFPARPPEHFNALILQDPVFARSSSSLLKQQHLPESGILLMTFRAYWSKRRVVNPSSFQN